MLHENAHPRLLEPPELPAPLDRYVGLMRATLRQPAALQAGGHAEADALARLVGGGSDVSASKPVPASAGEIPQQAFYAPLFDYAGLIARWLGGDHAAKPPDRGAMPVPKGEGAFDPAEGAEVCRWAWDELALLAGRLACGQGPPGLIPAGFRERVRSASAEAPGLFRTRPAAGEGAAAGPESRWYHELVLLHALASAAMLTGDAEALELCDRAAAYHHAETQPDHATSQPWALHAFLRRPDYLPTADLLLLAARVHEPGGLGTIPRLLLADAVVCLSRRA